MPVTILNVEMGSDLSTRLLLAPLWVKGAREAVMPLKTKRWNDPKETDDGFRLLICRYWPRGVSKKKKTWDSECYQLGPSRVLHGAFYGKQGPPLGWDEYRQRYLAEMEGEEQQDLIRQLSELVAEGKTITLLCSSACVDESHCHRTLLRELIEQRVATMQDVPPSS